MNKPVHVTMTKSVHVTMSKSAQFTMTKISARHMQLQFDEVPGT